MKINTTKTVYTIFSNSPQTANKELRLIIDGKRLAKEENPVYLGATLDRQLNLNKHMQKVREKSSRRLNIVKRLASTQWGADKKTLRQLYIGYVRSTMEYNIALQSISSDSTQASLDKVESSAVHFIAGAMRSTCTAAGHIHTNIQPLGLRRDAAVMEMAERYRRQEEHQPNKKIVKKWKESKRIKKRSVLKARFIKNEYKSNPPGAVTQMLNDLDLPPLQLQLRRREKSLCFLYKISKGTVPAIDPSTYLKPIENKRRIKAKNYSDCVTNNVVQKHQNIHSKCFQLPPSVNTEYRNSFFPRTIVDWNQLGEVIVSAESVDTFKSLFRELNDG